MTKWSKVLSADNFEEYESWEMPDVVDVDDKGVMTAEAIEDIQKQAHDEAFKQGLAAGQKEGYENGQKEGFSYGHQEGLTQGKAEIQAIYQQYERIIALQEQPLQALDEAVEKELVALTLGLAKHVIQHELKTTPEHIVAVVRQVIPLLPVSARRIQIKVHPDDAVLLKAGQGLLELVGKELIEDAAITRGGCDVLSEHSRIDATLEARIKTAFATVLNCDVDDVEATVSVSDLSESDPSESDPSEPNPSEPDA